MTPGMAAAELEVTGGNPNGQYHWYPSSTTVATVAVALSMITLAVVAIVALHQRDTIKTVAQRQCAVANTTRIGGDDYVRPLIREAWRRHGDDDLAAKLGDLAQLDCVTGKEKPLPPGAQK